MKVSVRYLLRPLSQIRLHLLILTPSEHSKFNLAVLSLYGPYITFTKIPTGAWNHPYRSTTFTLSLAYEEPPTT